MKTSIKFKGACWSNSLREIRKKVTSRQVPQQKNVANRVWKKPFYSFETGDFVYLKQNQIGKSGSFISDLPSSACLCQVCSSSAPLDPRVVILRVFKSVNGDIGSFMPTNTILYEKDKFIYKIHEEMEYDSCLQVWRVKNSKNDISFGPLMIFPGEAALEIPLRCLEELQINSCNFEYHLSLHFKTPSKNKEAIDLSMQQTGFRVEFANNLRQIIAECSEIIVYFIYEFNTDLHKNSFVIAVDCVVKVRKHMDLNKSSESNRSLQTYLHDVYIDLKKFQDSKHVFVKDCKYVLADTTEPILIKVEKKWTLE